MGAVRHRAHHRDHEGHDRAQVRQDQSQHTSDDLSMAGSKYSQGENNCI